ncbi:MAG: sigma-70 family RNA polymerase sigma factor [Bacteroidales bacterium]|nr:sigma-70 family RNA polymerase sigma factor [Bacteroidales bacterium]
MEISDHLTEKGRRDYALVQRALNEGDQKAYAELLNHYRDSLYFMMLKMTNNPADADDLTIEAFGKAFKKLGQYTPDYTFSTWLFKIASNNCIDFIRRNSRIQISAESGMNQSETNYAANQLIDAKPDPEETIIKEQKIKMMHEVVGKLKPHYRKLIQMRYFDEMSYEEISIQLRLPIGTVKAQLFRAREFLFQILKNQRENL